MLFDKSTKQDLSSPEKIIRRLNSLWEINRFPHATLLVSRNRDAVDDIVYCMGNTILECECCDKHLDFFSVSLDCESRTQITSDVIHELIANIQATPKIAKYKVAYIKYADLMNDYASNSFLKTLEEPPVDTFIFLSVKNQYDVIPTILSRCVVFNVFDNYYLKSDTLGRITNMYESWLEMLYDRGNNRLNIIEMYKLLSFIEDHWEVLMEEVNLNKSEIMDLLFSALEMSTANIFKKHLNFITKLHNIIEKFDHSRYYLAINCNIISCLEQCFIQIVEFFDKNTARENYEC